MTTNPFLNHFLNANTALAALQQRQSMLIAAPDTFNASRLTMATAVALAAGHISPSPLGAGWTAPVLFLSLEQTTEELAATAEEVAGTFGMPMEGSLRLLGRDALESAGFPAHGQTNVVNQYQSTLAGILRRDKVKTVVLDMPDSLPLSYALAAVGRQQSVPTLAVTSQMLDRPGTNVFYLETSLITNEDGQPALRFDRPFGGFVRPLELPGLLKAS